MKLAKPLFATALLAVLTAPGLLRADLSPALTPADTRKTIQNAIDAAANLPDPGTVTLGNGVFEIDAQLMVTGGVTVVGQGWTNTTIKQTTSGSTARCATVGGGARLEGVTLTGGRLTEGWKHGAGVDLDGGTVSWCRITDNKCTERNSYGGGVHVNAGTIDHCIVDSNQAGTYTSGGGGIGAHSALGPIVIDTCLVYGNTASVTEGSNDFSGGGGLCFLNGPPVLTIRNTTIVGNSVKGLGGGLRTVGDKTTLVNCIVSGNAAETGDEISGDLASGSSNNFIGGDPQFADAANGDYRLGPCSFAIFAGTNRGDAGTDLDGTAFASPPSMGCYEFTGTPMVNAPVFPYGTNVTFDPAVSVPLTCPNDGASIHYTLDGTDPTDADTLYEGPIGLAATTTIKARAYKAGMIPSRVVEATYSRGMPTEPAFGEVVVAPSATSAMIAGEIASVGNNLATSCDVYLAFSKRASNLGAAKLIVSGATSSFTYVIPGLNQETTYYYELTIRNNAQTVLSASTGGAFTTTLGILPIAGDAAATRNLIQTEIDVANLADPVGTVSLDSGLFEIDSQLMVTGGVRLVGQGMDRTIIKQTALVSASVNEQATRVMTIDGGSTVEHLALTGGKVTGGNYQYGGGALVKDGTISWCCITNNSVYGNNTKYGGGVCFVEGGGGRIDHCIVADNLASTQFGDAVGGGGIGVYKPFGPVTVESCLVYGNRSVLSREQDGRNHMGRGGGIGIDFQSQPNLVTILNTTIAENAAGEAGSPDGLSKGGAVFTTGDSKSKLSMLNCLVAGNTTAGTNVTMSLQYAGGVDYCLFDVADDKLGEHSKVGDPKFVRPSQGNYHLSPGSPAVGAAMWYDDIPEDLDGLKRRKRPAAGCYEIKAGTLLILR